ncbi:MAG: DUF2281 domain-containing protein, partial [Cyanobacteria bacterium J06623_7]
PKEELIQQLDCTADSIIVEVLDFLQFLKAKQEQDSKDIKDARAALSTVETEGTVSWDELKTEAGL